MSWREQLATHIGPGLLAGITFGDWLKLLAANHFAITPACSLKAAFITCGSITNSMVRCYESWRYSARIRGIEVPPPVFVLGHWRSGTTLVHDLLSLDDRFASPNLYQVSYPHTFLTTEKSGSGMMRLLGLKHRPQDNMRVDPQAAWEDEFAMCALGFRSPYLSWAFPRRAGFYDRFLTFADATPREIDCWRAAFRSFIQKLTFKYGKPLVLKSPTHTARIKLLLEMFPKARFIHIHRNPYAVFQSTLHTYATVLPICRLQSTGVLDWTERVLRNYKEMYEAFFAQRSLVPANHFHEMCFEQLERDPVGVMRKAYEAINLPDFTLVEHQLRQYVDSLSNYRKNTFRQLPAELWERISTEWRRSFDEWGYSIQ